MPREGPQQAGAGEPDGSGDLEEQGCELEVVAGRGGAQEEAGGQLFRLSAASSPREGRLSIKGEVDSAPWRQGPRGRGILAFSVNSTPVRDSQSVDEDPHHVSSEDLRFISKTTGTKQQHPASAGGIVWKRSASPRGSPAPASMAASAAARYQDPVLKGILRPLENKLCQGREFPAITQRSPPPLQRGVRAEG
ncbi:unnamed protein product [Rangifer tarandus platyrhynchus]|uniref:Uncharacterized protein n=1 Tax=Rangifer tarandus platyrhynchus TaxID=3082113 RepID=A0ABN8Y5T1_RANTA|nr:unnamed protein product [Rangifer tarandus platyrhynchus]